MAGLIIEKIGTVACDFRTGATGAASDGFAKVIDLLIEFLQSAPAGVDPSALLPLLQKGLEAQQRADYIALADLLEFEIAPRLQPDRL